MWTKVGEFIEGRITQISQFLILAFFLLWLASEFISPLETFLTTGTFFNVLTLVLLFEIGRRVVELKTEGGPGTGVMVFASQDASWTEVQSRIKQIRPRTVDMIEYSGQTTINIIEEVLAVEPRAVVRLLVCHPEHALSDFEKRRIQATLDYLNQHLSNASLTVRGYTPPASIRGRNFADQIVSLGWYSYHRRGTKKLTEIQGHLNAMVTARVDTPEGRDLLDTFSRAFDDLWTHPESTDWKELVS